MANKPMSYTEFLALPFDERMKHHPTERFWYWQEENNADDSKIKWATLSGNSYCPHIDVRIVSKRLQALSKYGLCKTDVKKQIVVHTNNKGKAENGCWISFEIRDYESGKTLAHIVDNGDEANMSALKSIYSDALKRAGVWLGIGTRCYEFPKVTTSGSRNIKLPSAMVKAANEELVRLFEDGLSKEDKLYLDWSGSNNVCIYYGESNQGELLWQANAPKPLPAMEQKQIGNVSWQVAIPEAYPNYNKVKSTLENAINAPEGAGYAVLSTFTLKEQQVKDVMGRLTFKALFMLNDGFYFIGKVSPSVQQKNPNIEFNIYQIAEMYVPEFCAQHKDAQLIILS